jgi:hypothetical protein
MQPWDEESNGLFLFTKEEFEKLPDGIELTSIMNDKAIKGKDEINLDTRSGHIAWGVKDPWNHPLKHQFLIFKLTQ